MTAYTEEFQLLEHAKTGSDNKNVWKTVRNRKLLQYVPTVQCGE